MVRVGRGGRASNAPPRPIGGAPAQAAAGRANIGVAGFNGTCFITNPGPAGWPDATNTGTLGAVLTTINVGTATWRTSIQGAGLWTTQVIGGNSYHVFTNKAFVLSTGNVYVDDPYVMFDHCSFTSSGANFCMVQLAGGGTCQTLRAVDCSMDGGPNTNRGIAGDDGHIVVLRMNATRTGEAAVEKNDRNGLWDFTVTDSYIHDDKGWISGQHVDGLQFGGARNVTIQHNTIWIEPYRATDGNTNDVSNSCIGGWSELGNVSGNILIDNNQMAGGGSVMYCEQKSPWTMQGTVTVSNNVFVRNHFPSLQGSNYTPITGHAAVWFVLAPPGRPASLQGAGSGWINNKWEDGTICTLAEAITAANNGGTPPPPPSRPDIVNAPAASNLILWCGIALIDELSDATFIDLRDNWGITTLAIGRSYMYTMGGGSRFNAPITATFNSSDGRTGTEWNLARSIKYGNNGVGTVGLGNIVNRIHALGMKIYLGTRWFNLNNTATPLFDWFDDTAWTTLVNPTTGPLAEHINYAKAWGFDGITMDDEPIGFPSGPEPTWKYNYGGNGQNEATTRAKVKQRGASIGALFASLWPDMDIIEYNTTGTGGFPDDWDEDFKQLVNDPTGNVKEASTQRDLWDGIFSVAGFVGTLRFLSSTFYKAAGSGATWFGAEQYNMVRQLARVSRTWTSWNLAHDRFFINPFHWPGRAANQAGGEDFPMSLATIQAAFAASRIMGMGNIAFYSQTISNDQIYFTTAMKAVFAAARVPGTVNTAVPSLSTIAPSGRSGNNITLTGSAQHPLGIRYIEWEVYNAGGTAIETRGAFPHFFVPGANDYADATGYSDALYTFTGTISAPVGRKVRVTAVTIKGQSHSTEITV